MSPAYEQGTRVSPEYRQGLRISPEYGQPKQQHYVPPDGDGVGLMPRGQSLAQPYAPAPQPPASMAAPSWQGNQQGLSGRLSGLGDQRLELQQGGGAGEGVMDPPTSYSHPPTFSQAMRGQRGGFAATAAPVAQGMLLQPQQGGQQYPYQQPSYTGEPSATAGLACGGPEGLGMRGERGGRAGGRQELFASCG